ncbi:MULTISPECIES: procyclic acidic repetitive family protein [unclassified Solwaraspora]|uniref:procyclic acidic repetitive family protein n=1 Tax=unclassified Solwaraspora TaxID=2627926 RepID=UPI00248C168C|nr:MULTISPECIES: procyclic acidic repetitive family protein [unclassified Solwaraspora]WBB96824.1 procyclic acidic repetitive family protein [Solwaraspora sp. WMMA2059]WBC19271.1 procyclic acidic repetitive family protein [Solwaraspora sp. WMMA2080]WJK33285.1 procyclic acidic repetitive family protein [Solwaraspora sp. WMMA2065]
MTGKRAAADGDQASTADPVRPDPASTNGTEQQLDETTAGRPEAEPTDDPPETKPEPTDDPPETKPEPTDDPPETKPEPPADPFTAFGPAPQRPPGRLVRARRAVVRVLIHEWSLATVAALVVAVAMTWPTLRYPLYTIPQDTWDPTLQAWQMAWSGHILLTDPTQLWQSNTFYPQSWSFAFSDTLLGYAPAGMIGEGPVAAVLRYNIIFVLAHALAALGAYALIRQLGTGRTAAAVGAAGYAYAPWLLSQAGHLHIVSNGGIPLALAMLARGHGWSLRYGYRPQRRSVSWALAGWLTAAWQVSLGFGIGLPFIYILAVICLVSLAMYLVRRTWFWPQRKPFGAVLLLTDLAGGALFTAVGVLLAIPYFRVAELHPNAARTMDDLAAYSPPVSGFFTAPAESLIWGDRHADARAALPWHPEMTLLPGFVLYALALAGLVLSIWTWRQRLLLLAGVLLTGILAMGSSFFDGTYSYGLLFEYVPGWDGIRTPGRMMLWTTLLLAILAAGAVAAFVGRVDDIARQRVTERPGALLRLATLLPLLLVLVEGLNVTPHPEVPEQPQIMRVDDGPILVLPSSQNLDQHVMLWSTTRFQPVVNGGSGFTPDQLAEVREVTRTFPDRSSIGYLRELGVRTVVLRRDQVLGTPWQTTVDLPVDGLGIDRVDIGDTVVYRL